MSAEGDNSGGRTRPLRLSEFGDAGGGGGHDGGKRTLSLSDFYEQIGFGFEPDDEGVDASATAGATARPVSDILATTPASTRARAEEAGAQAPPGGEDPPEHNARAGPRAASPRLGEPPPASSAAVAPSPAIGRFTGDGELTRVFPPPTLVTQVDPLATTRVKPPPAPEAQSTSARTTSVVLAGDVPPFDTAARGGDVPQQVDTRHNREHGRAGAHDQETVVDELFAGGPAPDSEEGLRISDAGEETSVSATADAMDPAEMELPPDLGFGVGDVLPALPTAGSGPRESGLEAGDDDLVDIMADLRVPPSGSRNADDAGDVLRARSAAEQDLELELEHELGCLFDEATAAARLDSAARASADVVPEAADTGTDGGEAVVRAASPGGVAPPEAGPFAQEPVGAGDAPGEASAWSDGGILPPDAAEARAGAGSGADASLEPDRMDDVPELRLATAPATDGEAVAAREARPAPLRDDQGPASMPASPTAQPESEALGASAVAVDAAGASDPEGAGAEAVTDDVQGAPASADLLPSTASQALAAGAQLDSQESGWEALAGDDVAAGGEAPPPEVDLADMPGSLPGQPGGAPGDGPAQSELEVDDLADLLSVPPLVAGAENEGGLVVDLEAGPAADAGSAEEHDASGRGALAAMGGRVLQVGAGVLLTGLKVSAEALDIKRNWGIYCDLLAAMITVVSLATIVARLVWYP